MFEHVIVSVDGGLEARAVLAPAADLAWRCGAKLVVVSTTRSAQRGTRDLLKGQAMARSGADVDFWVDPTRDPGDALLETVAHRSAPIVCLASRYRDGGLLRRRGAANPLPASVMRRSTAPVLVIGPEMEVGGGLPVGELFVPLDDGPASHRAALMAGSLARSLRLAVRLLVLVPPSVDDPHPPATAAAIAEEVRVRGVETTCEVVQTAQPAAALAAIAGESEGGVVVCPETGGDHRRPLGPFAAELVATSTRAVLFPPPGA